MAMAMRASVTVSMAEAMIGMLRRMVWVSRVATSTSLGRTSERPGRSSTSSKVSPSMILSANTEAMANSLKGARSDENSALASWHGSVARAFGFAKGPSGASPEDLPCACFALCKEVARALSPASHASIPPSPADHRDRPVHGEHGFDRDLHLAADDRAGPGDGPDRPQAGPDLLSGQPRDLHPDLGLDGRQVRRPDHLHRGHRRVHGGLARLRGRQFPRMAS